MSATQPSRDYLSCAETAKLVRKALRNQLPDAKFSVRSSTYAGGASIDISWTDGPTTGQVDAIVGVFQGASFDGMIDLKSYHDSLIADENGNVRTVHFGADFIHTQRRTSDARRVLYRREVERFLGRKFGNSERIPVSVCGRYGQPELTGQLSRDDHGGEWGSSVVEQIGHLRPWKGERCPGGDDSYCPGCGRWQGSHRGEHLR